jgi:hypothetical protein
VGTILVVEPEVGRQAQHEFWNQFIYADRFDRFLLILALAYLLFAGDTDCAMGSSQTGRIVPSPG